MIPTHRTRVAVLVASIFLTGSFFFAHTAHAAEIFSVTPTSGGEGDEACAAHPSTDCSLREALNVTASNNINDIITLAPGSYDPGETRFEYAGSEHGRSLTLTGDDGVYIENSDLGGMLLTMKGAVNVSHITFRNNNGPGLVVQDSDDELSGSFKVNIHDFVFDSNQSNGLFIIENFVPGSVSLQDDTFTNNTSPDLGGGFGIVSGDGEGGFEFPVTIDGIVSTGNHAASSSGGGGDVLTRGPDSPITVTNSAFTDNAAYSYGGGLSVMASGANSPVLVGGEESGNIFTGNIASNDSGGGLSADTNGVNSPITVQENEFYGNHAYWGGGFYTDTNGFAGDTTVTAIGNTVGGSGDGQGNSADTQGGGVYMWAGDGIVFERNAVIGNSTPYDQGGGANIHIDRTDLNDSTNSISHNTFTSNTAGFAGGLAVTADCACDLTLDGNTMSKNVTASGSGGMELYIYGLTSNPIITNNVIVDNETSYDSAAGAYIYTEAWSAPGVDFVNNTVSGNHLSSSDGVGVGVMFSAGISGMTWNILNNIFWNNTGTGNPSGADVFITDGNWDSLRFANNDVSDICVQGDATECNNGNDYRRLDLTDSTGNLYAENPWFVDPAVGDYHLASISPVLGMGVSSELNPSQDYDNVALADVPDLGAYQFTAIDLPEVETGTATQGDGSRVTITGVVTDSGESDITQAGVRYGDIEDDYTEVMTIDDGIEMGEPFSFGLTRLHCGTTYQYVVFATTENGTGYGEEKQFRSQSCGGTHTGGESAPSEPAHSSTPTDAPVPHFNSYTGHWEAPDLAMTGPSPYDASTEPISATAAGWYIRAEHYDTVYLVTPNGYRRTFLDKQSFLTYTQDWNKVIWVTDATLPTLPLGPTMLPKPGVVLVKMPGEGNVYAASMDADFATLHKIPSEEIAKSVFGADWADYVIDVLPALFSHYALGADVAASEHWDKGVMKKRADLK